MKIAVLALVLGLLGGCAMQTVRTVDNGDEGAEELKLPVPVWPFGPCQKEDPSR